MEIYGQGFPRKNQDRTNRQITIYALFDPRDRTRYRYVGASGRPSMRLDSRVKEAQDGGSSLKCIWIRSLLKEGVHVEMIYLEVATEDWRKRERYWISQMLSEGHRLLNVSFGAHLPVRRGDLTEPLSSPTPAREEGLSLEQYAAKLQILKGRLKDLPMAFPFSCPSREQMVGQSLGYLARKFIQSAK